MAKIEEKPWYFNDKLRAQQMEDHRALLELRAELAALPAEAVHRPLGNVAAFVEAALLAGEEARAAGLCSDVQIARVERLAKALRGAQLAYLYKTTPERADPGLAVFVDRILTRLEGDADALVASGRFRFHEIARAPGSSVQDWCTWALALVAFFREHRLASTVKLAKVETTTKKLRPFAAETADELEITALRDRAYTELSAALDDLRHGQPVSGVYGTDLFELEPRRKRLAA